MRTRLATICLVASTFVLSPVVAYAQPKKPRAPPAKKDDKKAADDKKTPRDVDLDADVKEGPVTAGQMTEEAAQGKRLFDNERWSEAALGLEARRRRRDGRRRRQQADRAVLPRDLALPPEVLPGELRASSA